MEPHNLIVVMSDEHDPPLHGAYGPSAGPDAEHGPAGGARHGLHSGVYKQPDLRAGAGQLRDRPLCP